MNSKINLLPIILVALIGPAMGQQTSGSLSDRGIYAPLPDRLAQIVLLKNRTLLAAKEKYRTATMEARTGNTPPNPEVELGYLFGKPDEMGNRIDFSVSQEIDFPTAYIHRSRTRKLEIEKAALMLDLTRQEVLLESSRLWIERVYLNQLGQILRNRLLEADRVLSHYRQQLSVGEIGQLAFSQANLQSTALRGELEKIEAEIRENQVAMVEITGDTSIQVTDALLPRSVPFDVDTLKSAYQESALMQYFNREVALTEQKKQLTASLSLPKISAGYYSESVVTEQFRGVQVGISIPLWEHSNQIERAKSAVIFAEADAARMASDQRKEVNQLIERWKSLDKIITDMEQALSMVNDFELLNLAWEEGEISLAEYMVGSDLYFRNLQSMLTYRKDQLIVEAELFRVYY